MKRLTLNLLILISLLLTSTQIASASPSEAEIQQAVLVQINQYRQQHGLGKLTMNAKITEQAKKHSRDMANHSIPFGHNYFMQRINTLHKQVKKTGAGAENVAYNYKTAEDVVRNWLKSPGHKHNIDGNYDLTGIGVVRDAQGRLYYTQIFLRSEHTQHAAVKKPIHSLFSGSLFKKFS